MSSTFEATRANAILDSLAAKIANEIVYHKNKWGSARTLTNDVSIMKGFSANRPNSMMNFIGSRFLTNPGTVEIQINSNNPRATYTFNSEIINDAKINLKHFKNQTYSIKANEVGGYKFKHWEIGGSTSGVTTLIANNNNWKYFDGNDMPASNWSSVAYNDGSWKNGNAPLGYNSSNSGITTTISYGANASNKYTTAYFRKTINITNLSSKNSFTVSTLADDGIVLYVNGTEVGRDNMPNGTISFSTVATTYNNGATASFNVPKELLVEGNNVIAAEVHQNSVSSSDLIFNLQMSCTESTNTQTETNETYTGLLTAGISLKAIYEQSVFEDPDKDLSVFINEVVSSNNTIADEFGDKYDFIEIYNAGEADVNISGWYISDIPSSPAAFQIPDTDLTKTLIPAKNRLVLWADDEIDLLKPHILF